MTINIDMDGVISDFDLAIKKNRELTAQLEEANSLLQDINEKLSDVKESRGSRFSWQGIHTRVTNFLNKEE